MTEPKTIRVMIVDDHAVVRSGLSAFLMICDDFELVGEAKNGEQALKLCDQVKPDVILMDLVMPGMDGATATRLVREKCPGVQVIALTSFKEREQVQSAIQAGAISYLLKDVSAEELARAIRAACEGKPTLAPEAIEALIQSTCHEIPRPGSDLTEREREVLRLICEGMNNQQIADHLVLGLSTVKSHISNILSKLGVSSRTEAASIALRYKIN
ncbi:MAG: response regulator transcription factor [Chloroflexi bacterium]|nr:response regulator transcription factor [Chloroflexota bacterium]